MYSVLDDDVVLWRKMKQKIEIEQAVGGGSGNFKLK